MMHAARSLNMDSSLNQHVMYNACITLYIVMHTKKILGDSAMLFHAVVVVVVVVVLVLVVVVVVVVIVASSK